MLCEEVNRVWKLRVVLETTESTVSTTALGNYFIGPFPGACLVPKLVPKPETRLLLGDRFARVQ